MKSEQQKADAADDRQSSSAEEAKQTISSDNSQLDLETVAKQAETNALAGDEKPKTIFLQV